jgi:hypothetical protein
MAIPAPSVSAATFEPAPCPTSKENPALAMARCGVLVVPENRGKPSDRTIRLTVALVPAKTPTPAAERRRTP